MSDSVMFLMWVMFLSMAKRIYLMSSGHQYLLVNINTSSIINSTSSNGTLKFPSYFLKGPGQISKFSCYNLMFTWGIESV